MTQSIILSSEQKENNFLFGSLFDLNLKCEIAVVKFPVSLKDAHKDVPEGDTVVFMLRNPTNVMGEMEFTRYEMHSAIFTSEMSKDQDLLKLDSIKDGYVFLPKTLRDGRHSDMYVLIPQEESIFTFHVGNGMYEEVCWSPFGDERGSIQQEEANAKINPQLRRYNVDGYDKI